MGGKCWLVPGQLLGLTLLPCLEAAGGSSPFEKSWTQSPQFTGGGVVCFCVSPAILLGRRVPQTGGEGVRRRRLGLRAPHWGPHVAGIPWDGPDGGTRGVLDDR